MSACRCNLQGPFGGFLSLDLRKVGPMFAVFGNARSGRRQQRLPFEMIEQAQQIGRGNDFDLPRPIC